MSAVHNERVELLAAALDRASTACLAVGVLTALANAPLWSWRMAASLAGWVLAALVLHSLAQAVLGGLRDD